jgi:fructose-bisphosphate aldolase, class II
MASTGAICQFVSQPENASELDARKIYIAARDVMQALCQARYEAFGSARHASKIRVVSLSEMAKHYD